MKERKNYGNDYQKFGGLNIGRDLRLWGFPQDIFDSLFCQATEEELRMQLGNWSAVGGGGWCYAAEVQLASFTRWAMRLVQRERIRDAG